MGKKLTMTGLLFGLVAWIILFMMQADGYSIDSLSDGFAAILSLSALGGPVLAFVGALVWIWGK